MRKINMKRKGKKEQVQKDEENGVEEKSNDPKNSSDEEAEKSGSDEEPEPEPELKKRKSDKRKSVSFSKKKNAKGAKKDVEKPPEDEVSEDDEEAEYEVEEVLDEKMMKGVRHYLIRWKGYEPESDSWEPESTLECADLIKKFRASRADKNGEESSSDSPKRGKKSPKKEKKPKDKKKKNAKKTDDAENVDWDSNDEFEVDRILDVYFKRNGKREFLVSWKGYNSNQDSWEPEENLECRDLITKFMSKVDAAKNVDQKELRLHRQRTERFTLNMHSGDAGRRLSRRLSGKQRVQYHDAE